MDFLGDFSNIEELQKVMTDVVENGELKDDNDKTCAIEKGNYPVVVVKDSEGNWILSAFDFITPKKEKIKRKDAATHDTPGQPNVEAGAVTPNLPISKDIQNSPSGQTNPQKTDTTTRYSRNVGGNKGYVGYSMSKRAQRARGEGRYPKTDFKREYNIGEKAVLRPPRTRLHKRQQAAPHQPVRKPHQVLRLDGAVDGRRIRRERFKWFKYWRDSAFFRPSTQKFTSHSPITLGL